MSLLKIKHYAEGEKYLFSSHLKKKEMAQQINKFFKINHKFVTFDKKISKKVLKIFS